MERARVLLFGGYGVFGTRIAADLLQRTRAQVVIAGRDLARAQAACARLGPAASPLECDLADAAAVDRAVRRAAVVIVAAGPFQQLPLTALRAALSHRAHYIDLSDSRAYLRRVAAERASIEAANVAVLSGLSTVAGISAVLAGWGALELGGIDGVHIALSPGNRNPRGVATIGSVLSSVGQPIQVWQRGRWKAVIGWTGEEQIAYPAPVGPRRVYWAESPDYDILPRELGCRDVTFKAGLELGLLNRSLFLLSWLRQRRSGFVLERYARLLMRLSMLLVWVGTEHGGLRVTVQRGGETWRADLIAERDGPAVAATPAAVAAARLLRGESLDRGLIALSRWITAPSLVRELEDRGMTVQAGLA